MQTKQSSNFQACATVKFSFKLSFANERFILWKYNDCVSAAEVN